MKKFAKHGIYIALSIFFLTQPFFIHRKIFLNKAETTGIVKQIDDNQVILYNVENKQYAIPVFKDLADYGDTVRIAYNVENPQNAVLYTFPGLYFSKKMILPLFLFLLLSALHFSKLTLNFENKSNDFQIKR